MKDLLYLTDTRFTVNGRVPIICSSNTKNNYLYINIEIPEKYIITTHLMEGTIQEQHERNRPLPLLLSQPMASDMHLKAPPLSDDVIKGCFTWPWNWLSSSMTGRNPTNNRNFYFKEYNQISVSDKCLSGNNTLHYIIS